MNNNVQVNLQFTANTAQARQELANLQTQLTALINQPVPIGAKMTADIQKATAAAAELKVHLQNATNVKTGMLDFGKLNQSIKQSGMSLSQYGAKLQALGPQGQQAFMQLANSIAAAEVPIRRASGALAGMMTTFKNTAKWMVSSTVLNGFIRTMSSAYGYAKDLNESLNNIRIVTGHNIDQMAKFATEANKAAKALSTTTTAYTNASLIYYQQGLSDQEVKERTDVTIKMANVSRQSAEVVSDQMTAVWNNFYDGSKSLEYYSDAMTALGAATASSTDEIAQGLEKFAAVSKTVGLSYEYATAALATVTAQTRQSADVVGTAFKTLFARIQDLKLGETLDDGTTLGQYSDSLMKVGINIKDASGQLKDMDTILEEMGAKWQKLEQDQKVALAKSVAGIRQYNQLIALMDNWDFMQENLQIVEDSSGTLQKQQDIYAESWEAASKRVRASAEQIYSSLLKDDFFIDLTNGFSTLIDNVGVFIKSLGGLKGVLSAVGLILTRVFHDQMAQGLRNMAYNIKMSTELGQKMVQMEKAKEMRNFAGLIAKPTSDAGPSLVQQTQADVYTRELAAQEQIISNSNTMNELEKQKAQMILDQTKAYGQQSIELAKQIELEQSAQDKRLSEGIGKGMLNGRGFSEMNRVIKSIGASGSSIEKINIALQNTNKNGQLSAKSFSAIQSELKSLGFSEKYISQLTSGLSKVNMSSDQAQEAMHKLLVAIQKVQNGRIDKLVSKMFPDGGKEAEAYRAELEAIAGSAGNLVQLTDKLRNSNKNAESSFKTLTQIIQSGKTVMNDWANRLASFTSVLMSAGMMVSAFSGLMDTLSNPDMSGWEKFGAILTSVSMILMSMTSLVKNSIVAFKGITKVINGDTINRLANAAAAYAQERQLRKTAQAKVADGKASDINTQKEKRNTKAKVENTVADFVDSKGRTRSYSGRVDIKNRAIDDNGRLISQADMDKYGFKAGKAPKATPGHMTTGSALKTLLPSIGGAALVAAGIAAIGVSIHLASEALNKDAREAQEATKMAQAAQENYNKERESYNTFKSQADEYREAVQGLENLTKGTLEYEEAVAQANQKALELLKLHKDLEYEYNNATGLIEIDIESLAKKQREELKAMKAAQDASIMANNEAIKAQERADQTELARTALTSKDVWNDDDAAHLGGTVGSAAGAAAVMAGIALMNSWNPIGWVLGIVGGIAAALTAGGVIGASYNDAEEAEYKALETLQAIYEQGEDITEETIDDLALDDDELIKSLKDNIDEVRELVKEMSENSLAVKKNTEAIIGDIAGEDAGLLSGKFDEIQNQITQEYASIIEDISRTDDYKEDTTFTNFIDEYNKLTGNNLDLTSGEDDVRMTDQGLKVFYTDKDGNEQSKLLNIMVKELSLIKAKIKLEPYIDNVQQLINNIENEGAATVIQKAAQGEGKYKQELTQNDIDDYKNELSKYNGDLDKFLIETFKVENLDELAKQWDLKTADQVRNRFTEVDKAQEILDNLYSKSETVVRDYYNKLLSNKNIENIFKDMTVETQTQFRDFLSNSFQIGGDEALIAFHNIFQEIPIDKIDEFVGVINGVEWSSTSPEEFNKSLLAVGISTQIANSKVQEFIELMNNGVVSIETISAQTKELINIVNNLKAGDTISAEDYQKLVDSELGMEKYFTLMYDGTYKLTDAALDFKNIFKENFVKKAQETQRVSIDSYNKLLQNYENTVSNFANGYQSKFQDLVFNENYKYEIENGNLQSYDLISEGEGKTQFQKLRSDSYSWTANNRMVNSYFDTDELQKKAQELYKYSDKQLEGSIYKFTSDGGLQIGIPADNIDNNGIANPNKYIYKDVIDAEGAAQNFIRRWYGDLKNKDDPSNIQKAIQEMWEFSASMGLDAELKEKLNMESFDLELFMKDYDANLEQLQEIYEQAGQNFENALADLANFQKEAQNAYQTIVSTAETQKELLEIQRDSQYENIGDEAFRAAVISQHSLALRDAEEMEDLEPEEVQEYAKYLQETEKALKDNSDMANEAARRMLRLKKATDSLADGYEDWNNILNSTNKSSVEHAEAINDMREAISDYLGVSKETISTELLEDETFRQLIPKALEGDSEAYAELGKSVASRALQGIQNEFNAVIGEETPIDEIMNNLLDGYQMGDDKYLNVFNKLIQDATITASQLEDIFNALHLEPVYSETTFNEVPLYDTVQTQTVTRKPTGLLSWIDTIETTTTQTPNGKTQKIPGVVSFKKINIPPESHTGGGNSSSKSSTPNKMKKTDVVERYKEVNDQIDNVSRAYENASKAADRLYGQARLNQMKEMNKILANEVDLLAEKRAEAESYLSETDKVDLNKVAKENIGLEFKFDQNTGDITNYQEVMDAVWKDYNAYYEGAKSGGFNDKEQERLEDYEQAINNTKEAIAQYDETRELLEDIDDEIQAKLYEMQDNNYETFTYQIDIVLEIRDLKLDFNQYKVDKVMTDLLEAGASGKFKDLMNNRLGLLKEANNADNLDWLQSQFALGEENMAKVKTGELKLEDIDPEKMGISQKDYAEGLKNEYQTTMDNINALKEYDEVMQSYYGDTLAAANEEIEKYTSLMEHSANILDHYKNLMELTGKGIDYKNIGKILEGEAQIAADTLATSTAIYEERMSEAKTAYEAYQNALVSEASKETLETLKNTWLTAQQAANEAQEQMLSDTEAWAEMQNAILENSLADLGKSLEELATGQFGSYNELTTAIDRATARTEEWLTATNKIYETNKLINKAQQDLDKTSNTIAKRRLQNFMKETQELQKQSKLSNFELEVQQAKYNLLLAEIALEEAQNAKSTVRLQRDSEGNFGYVYTADQDAIDEAQQKYEDADNDLYKIRLKAANDYGQKTLQIRQEYYDTMIDLNEKLKSGEMTAEEYAQAANNAKIFFYDQIEQYSYLYGLSIAEDTRVAADAWSTEFQNIILDTEGWKIAVEEYIISVNDAFGTWSSNISSLYGTNGALASIETGVSGIVTTASSLKELLVGADGTGGIVQDAAQASSKALALAEEYAKTRKEIVGEGGLIEAYEEQLEEITGLIDDLSKLDNTSINVNQTQTYKTVLDTGNFNSSVKDFSAAVGQLVDNLGLFDSQEKVTAEIDSRLDRFEQRELILAPGISSTAAWTMDENGKNLVRQDDIRLTNADLQNAALRGSVHVGGPGGMTMYKLTINGKEYFIPGHMLASMDTGGYTGEWGPEGKIAMLHEKELVLNSDDTSNFLSALGLLDNILLTLDKYSASAQLGGLLNTPGFLMNNSEALEQNVHIEASFPGVTDRNEIEEAFNNLVNRASQYANRK